MDLLKKIINVEVKKPIRSQVIIPSVIFIGCMIIGGCMIQEAKKRSIDPPKTSFVAPGTTKINLSKLGSYTVYIESEIEYEGKRYVVPDGTIEDLEVKVSKGDVVVPVRKADIFYKYNKNGNKGESNCNFDITEKGEYNITTKLESDQNEQIILSIGVKNEEMLRVLQFTVGASVIMLVGIIQFIGYILSAVIKIFLYKRNNHI